ncbi:MAG: hypothetical protein DMF91_03180 [Acidobacteria bacterium]|nr:MAG: hypothetical protein DMF91_03180 [Acidobacteriota bacterium]
MPPPKPRRRLRRLLTASGLLVAVVVAPPLFIMIECAWKSPPERAVLADPPPVREAKRAIPKCGRVGPATYLTLPEWFIVYNSEEYAATLAAGHPSAFPYFRSIAQYWSYYRQVCHTACSRYPFDSGDHLMLAVIGSSFMIENVLKGVYENTIGRATEWLSSTDTEEDRYAAQTASEYGRFMHTTPWYEFAFGSKLSGVWTQTHAWGSHPLRKWERRFALSLEYGTKAGYGWVIRKSSKSVYGNEDEWVCAWADHVPDAIFGDPRIRTITRLDDGSHILALRRYEAFSGIVPQLVMAGVQFHDIAGNQRILVTALADRERPFPDDEVGHVLFARPVLTSPPRQRVAIDAAVGALGDLLKRLAASGVALEHIYDY